MKIRLCWIAAIVLLFSAPSGTWAGEAGGSCPAEPALPAVRLPAIGLDQLEQKLSAAEGRTAESRSLRLPAGSPVRLPGRLPVLVPVRLNDACDRVRAVATASQEAVASEKDPTFGPESFWRREGRAPRPIEACADNLGRPGESECVVASESRHYPGVFFIAIARLDGSGSGRLWNDVGPFYGTLPMGSTTLTSERATGSSLHLGCGSAGTCHVRKQSFRLDRRDGKLRYEAWFADTPHDLPAGMSEIVLKRMRWHLDRRGTLRCRPYD